MGGLKLVFLLSYIPLHMFIRHHLTKKRVLFHVIIMGKRFFYDYYWEFYIHLFLSL